MARRYYDTPCQVQAIYAKRNQRRRRRLSDEPDWDFQRNERVGGEFGKPARVTAGIITNCHALGEKLGALGMDVLGQALRGLDHSHPI